MATLEQAKRPYSADPQVLALRGRIGAFVLHSRYDARETTAAARSAFLARFENEVDPERVLSEAERLTRAEYARKAHFARLALKSAQVRAGRAKATKRTASTAHVEAVQGEAADVAGNPSL